MINVLDPNFLRPILLPILSARVKVPPAAFVVSSPRLEPAENPPPPRTLLSKVVTCDVVNSCDPPTLRPRVPPDETLIFAAVQLAVAAV